MNDSPKIYIRAHNEEMADGEEVYFGPFFEDEVDERLNDVYADALSTVYEEVDGVDLEDAELAHTAINDRDFWMRQVENLTHGGL